MAANPAEIPSQPVAAPPAATPQAAPAEWFLAENVKGSGDRPEWFDTAKYKTLADQAKAYPEARKRLGELEAKVSTIKPAPDKYELPSLKDFGDDVEWKADDPLLTKAMEVAKKVGLSQEAFTAMAADVMVPLIRNYEMVDIAAEKAAIGERADQRLDGLKSWAKANLSEEQYAAVVAPLGKWSRPSEVFAAMEALMQATRQPSLRPQDDARHSSVTESDWRTKWYARSEMKGHLYKIDEPGQREKAQAELAQIVGTGNHVEVVGRRA